MKHDYSSTSTSQNPDKPFVIEDTKSFVAFDTWMDDQLEQLVAQWIHTAAPNASRIKRGGLQLGGHK